MHEYIHSHKYAYKNTNFKQSTAKKWCSEHISVTTGKLSLSNFKEKNIIVVSHIARKKLYVIIILYNNNIIIIT